MKKSNIFSAILLVVLIGTSFISCKKDEPKVKDDPTKPTSIVGSWVKQNDALKIVSSDPMLQALINAALPTLGIEFFQTATFNEDGTGTFNDTTTFTYTKTEAVVTISANNLLLGSPTSYQMDLSGLPLPMEYTLTNDYNDLKLYMDITLPVKLLMEVVLAEMAESLPFPVDPSTITKADITANYIRK